MQVVDVDGFLHRLEAEFIGAAVGDSALDAADDERVLEVAARFESLPRGPRPQLGWHNYMRT